MSSAYHPQSNGQTEVVTRCLEQYLRAFVGDKPSTWASLLYLAEYWFNTNYHSSARMTPFEALYGYPPPRVLDYVPSTTQVVALDTFLHDRTTLLTFLK